MRVRLLRDWIGVGVDVKCGSEVWIFILHVAGKTKDVVHEESLRSDVMSKWTGG